MYPRAFLCVSQGITALISLVPCQQPSHSAVQRRQKCPACLPSTALPLSCLGAAEQSLHPAVRASLVVAPREICATTSVLESFRNVMTA